MRLVHLFLVCICLSAFVLAGCEDDPILGPGEEDDDGGSYGVLHFQRTPADTSDAPAARPLPHNPARF